jgi:hypothetical protein
MTRSLSSLSLIGILRKSVRIFVANILLFVGLALLPGLADLAGKMASAHPSEYAETSTLHSLLFFLSYLLSFVVWVIGIVLQAYCAGAICIATARILTEGKVTIGSALSAVNPRAIRLIWVSLMQALFGSWPLWICLILVVPITLQMDLLHGWGDWIVYGLVIVFGVIPTVTLVLRYLLATSACVIENISSYSSIERSIHLGRDSRWKIFWVFLLSIGPAAAISIALQWEIERHLSSLLFFVHYPIAFRVVDKLPDVVFGLVSIPFLYILLTLLYLQLLEQKDGISCSDVLNGALTPPKPLLYDDEEPGPWDDAIYSEPEVNEDSIGIPWSMFGAKDAVLNFEDETEPEEQIPPPHKEQKA